MKVLLLGATGMVGSGVLREALADADVHEVLVVGRRSCGVQDPKLKELLIPDLYDIAPHEAQLSGIDACLWAIGVTSAGMSEADYARVTETLTLQWAQTLLRLNPEMSFCYCCGAGADGSAMWAKVRKRLENALQAMPFAHVHSVRPALILPGPGIRSATPAYQFFLTILRPILPLLGKLFASKTTTSALLGRAMVRAGKGQATQFVLEVPEINRLGA